MEPPTPAKRTRRKKRYSNFLITINSNVRPTDDDDAQQLAAILVEKGKEFFTLQNILDCTTIRGGTAEEISRITIDTWSVELGQNTRGQRLHIHALLKYQHSTVIQINAQKVAAWWRESLMPLGRCQNVYVNVRWLPATAELARDYVEKGAHSAADAAEV